MNHLRVDRSGLEAQPMSWYCGCLLWTSWSRRIRWSLLPVVGSGFHGECKPSWYLLVKQCSRAQVIQDVFVVHWWLKGKSGAKTQQRIISSRNIEINCTCKIHWHVIRYTWILNELLLTDGIAKPVNNLWNMALGECSWRLEEKSSLLSSRRERDLGNYRPVSLSSISG